MENKTKNIKFAIILQEYLFIYFFDQTVNVDLLHISECLKPLSLDINMHILVTGLLVLLILLDVVQRICLSIKTYLCLVIIYFILITGKLAEMAIL